MQQADDAFALVNGRTRERGYPVAVPSRPQGDDLFRDVNFAGHNSDYARTRGNLVTSLGTISSGQTPESEL